MTTAAGGPAPAPPLVDVAWLRAHTGDADVVVLEVGEDATHYHLGHVPGAGSLDWIEELQEPVQRGFVSLERFQALMTDKGVHPDDHVVLYAALDPAPAVSAFWLMRYYRHRRLSLLDGGKTAWLTSGGALATEPRRRAPTPGGYTGAAPDPSVRITREEVLDRFVDAPEGRVLLDCRTPAEFAGHATHPLDLPVERHRVPGHVPGARNLPSVLLVDEAGRFRPLPELRALFAERGVDVGGPTEVGMYCRVAERSSLLWFALRELLGHGAVRNYDGGWAEYGSLVHAPVAHAPVTHRPVDPVGPPG